MHQELIELELDNQNQSYIKNKILFINLADDGDLGNKSTNALNKKVDNEITCIHLLDFAQRYKETKGINCPLPMIMSGIDINSYNQVIIGIHGFQQDRKNGYYLDFENKREYKPLFNAQQLADFFQFILKQKDFKVDRQLSIILSMCYGGRIDDYEQCYQHNLEPDVFKNSFAYRFIASFSEHYHIELSAYTGAVGFDAIDGNLWVETEEQLKISAEIDGVRGVMEQ